MKYASMNRPSPAALRRLAATGLTLGLTGLLTLTPSMAMAASDASAGNEIASAQGTPASSAGDNAGGQAPVQEEGAEKTYSVTFYHTEIMFYDDPTFVPEDDPRYEGMRLMQAITVDGFKAGDVVSAWDYVGANKGFTFFDGWPREIVVSDDESKNAIQLNYFRDTIDCTVNHYVIYDSSTLPVKAAEARAFGGGRGESGIGVVKVGENALDDQLFGDLLQGEDYADAHSLMNPSKPDEALQGLTFVGSYPSQMYVSTDEGRNEINLYYAVTAENLPDDIPVESAPEGGDRPGADDGVGDPDEGGSEGGSSEGDNGAGDDADGGNSDAAAGSGSDNSGNGAMADDPSGSDSKEPSEAGSDDDNAKNPEELHAKALPVTGDDASGTAASLPLVMGCALGGALVAHSQRRKA